MELITFSKYKKKCDVEKAKKGDKEAFLALINENRLNIFSFMLNVIFNKIQVGRDEKYIKGKWKFDIPVSNESTRAKVKEYDTKIDLGSIQKDLKVNKITTTPINTVLQISNKDNTENILNFIAFDDKGRSIERKSLNSKGKGDEEDDYIELTNIHFKEPYEDTKSITFIPYHMIFNEEQLKNSNSNNVDTSRKKEHAQDGRIEVKLNLNGKQNLQLEMEMIMVLLQRLKFWIIKPIYTINQQ